MSGTSMACMLPTSLRCGGRRYGGWGPPPPMVAARVLATCSLDNLAPRINNSRKRNRRRSVVKQNERRVIFEPCDNPTCTAGCLLGQALSVGRGLRGLAAASPGPGYGAAGNWRCPEAWWIAVTKRPTWWPSCRNRLCCCRVRPSASPRLPPTAHAGAPRRERLRVRQPGRLVPRTTSPCCIGGNVAERQGLRQAHITLRRVA